jgi:hypothetical protein
VHDDAQFLLLTFPSPHAPSPCQQQVKGPYPVEEESDNADGNASGQDNDPACDQRLHVHVPRLPAANGLRQGAVMSEYTGAGDVMSAVVKGRCKDALYQHLAKLPSGSCKANQQQQVSSRAVQYLRQRRVAQLQVHRLVLGHAIDRRLKVPSFLRSICAAAVSGPCPDRSTPSAAQCAHAMAASAPLDHTSALVGQPSSAASSVLPLLRPMLVRFGMATRRPQRPRAAQ